MKEKLKERALQIRKDLWCKAQPNKSGIKPDASLLEASELIARQSAFIDSQEKQLKEAIKTLRLCKKDYLSLIMFCREKGLNKTAIDAQESVDYIETTLASIKE